MTRRLRTTARCAAAAALALLLVAAASAEDRVFTGYARDIKSGALLYVESHFISAAGTAAERRVVLYRCANGSDAFARKELQYGTVREEPTFTFVDARSGYTEGLRRGPGGFEVFQQASSSAALRTASVPDDVAIVSDAGFDEFVRRHWDELQSGKTVRFPFLVPSLLDFLTFKVKKQGETNIEDSASSVIRLNLSGVLGWFLPYIEVSYRQSDRVLMRYTGLTNIRDLEGENLVALISFPARERRRVERVDLEVQRAVRLVSRCP